MHITFSQKPVLAFSILSLLLSCTTATEPPVQTPIMARIITGLDQQGRIGRELDSAIIALVSDSAGKPIAGQPLIWRVSLADSSACDQVFVAGCGSLSKVADTSDMFGKVATRWRLGTRAGLQFLTLLNPATSRPIVQLHATASPDTAVRFLPYPQFPVAASRVRLQAGDSIVVRLLYLDEWLNARARCGDGGPETRITWTVSAQLDSTSAPDALSHGGYSYDAQGYLQVVLLPVRAGRWLLTATAQCLAPGALNGGTIDLTVDP